ncbi:MAG: hypothetical protein ACI9BW_001152 [Gammaproteobacteria bacterium]|jgi:hypothetical protein
MTMRLASILNVRSTIRCVMGRAEVNNTHSTILVPAETSGPFE